MGIAGKDFTQQLAVMVGQYNPANTLVYILVDLRELAITMSILRLEVPCSFWRRHKHHYRRKAVLCESKTTTVMERFRFLEDNISRLLSISLKVFTDEALALEWLRSTTS